MTGTGGDVDTVCGQVGIHRSRVSEERGAGPDAAQDISEEDALPLLKPSFYNKYTEARDPSQTVVFNRFWGSVAVMDTTTVERLKSSAFNHMDADELAEMEHAGFVVP